MKHAYVLFVNGPRHHQIRGYPVRPDVIVATRHEKEAGNFHGHYSVRTEQGADYDAVATWEAIPVEDLASFRGRRNHR